MKLSRSLLLLVAVKYMLLQLFFGRPKNLADVCSLRQIRRLFVFQRFKLDLINHPSGETDCIYETTILRQHCPDGFQCKSIQSVNGENGLSLLMFFCFACNMVPENWYVFNKAVTYLLISKHIFYLLIM